MRCVDCFYSTELPKPELRFMWCTVHGIKVGVAKENMENICADAKLKGGATIHGSN